MKDKKLANSRSGSLVRVRQSRPLEELDYRKFLNRKITIYNENDDEEIGTVREVYKNYIMIVSDNRERYIPISKIDFIERGRN